MEEEGGVGLEEGLVGLSRDWFGMGFGFGLNVKVLLQWEYESDDCIFSLWLFQCLTTLFQF